MTARIKKREEDPDEEELPDIEDVLEQMRENEDNIYVKFLELIGPCVMGVKLWRQGFDSNLDFRKIMGTPMEAFSLLIYENHYKSLFDENLKAKYTKSGTGWDGKGIERFIELMKLVKKSRDSDGKAFDAHYKNYLKTKGGGGGAQVNHVKVTKELVLDLDAYVNEMEAV